MEYKDGIPSDHATLVVVPMMLSSTEVVRLEVEKTGSPVSCESGSQRFLQPLSDFTDSPEATAFGDVEVLAAARQGIEQLNSRYGRRAFSSVSSARVWSESEQRWIGRERKRGKLKTSTHSSCWRRRSLHQDRGELPLPIHYVITLDADTQLPPESGRRLIETLAHR